MSEGAEPWPLSFSTVSLSHSLSVPLLILHLYIVFSSFLFTSISFFFFFPVTIFLSFTVSRKDEVERERRATFTHLTHHQGCYTLITYILQQNYSFKWKEIASRSVNVWLGAFILLLCITTENISSHLFISRFSSDLCFPFSHVFI